MKNFYDLKPEEQKRLRKEFSRKYHANRKGIFIGIVLGLLISGTLIYYIVSKSLVGLTFSVTVYLVVSTILFIDENISFNRWLETSKKITK